MVSSELQDNSSGDVGMGEAEVEQIHPPDIIVTEDSPFAMPTDEDILRRRENSRRQKAEVRDQMKNMSVKDKSTFAYQMSTTITADRIRDVIEEVSPEDGK